MTQADKITVYTFINENPGSKTRDIARETGIAHATVSATVAALRKEGLVQPAVTDPQSTYYGQCWPVESECPDSVAAVEPDSPTATPGYSSVVALSDDDMVVVRRSELAALEAAKELAEENAGLKAQIATIRELLCTDGRPEDALCHLSDILVDAGVFVPTCDRAPNCKSLHLSTRIHDLADERDLYKHSHNAAAQQHSRLCKAFGLESADPEVLEAIILEAIQETRQQRKRADDAEKAGKEADEQRAHLARLLRVASTERNALENDLAEISWLCISAGFSGSGDVVDQFCWLVTHLGYPVLASAIPARRRVLGRIKEQEEQLRNLVIRVRMGLSPEISDRCACGNEARKVEGESGFTKCDTCYHQEGAE